MRAIASLVLAAAVCGPQTEMNIVERIRAAVGYIVKGGSWEGDMFNRVPPDGDARGASLSRPYAQSVWVERAIKKIAGPISSVPLMFGTGRDSKTTLDNPDLKAWWRHPAVGAKVRTGENRLLSFLDFVEASVGWIKLKGEAFWVMDDAWLVPFPEARGVDQWPKLIIARPDRMREVVEGNKLLGWAFTDRGGKTHALTPEQVIHIPVWNPYDDWRGLPEYEAAQVAAEADYLAGLYNRNLMRENGDRGPYIVMKNGVPNDAQRQQIIAQLREKKARSLRGEFRPAFLVGDMTVEDPKAQAIDTALVSQRLHNRHEIFLAFGVPASMADVVASYSIGSASDRFILIEDTCMPLAEKLAEHIGALSRSMTGIQGLEAWLDWDEHSVMQQVRAERIATADTLWQKGMPMEKVSEYLRLSIPEYEGWDVGYLPFNLSPSDQVGLGPDPMTDPAFNEPTDVPPADDEPDADDALAQEGIDQIQRAFGHCPAHTATETGSSGFQTRRDPREVARWTRYVAPRKVTMKAYENAWRRTMMDARRETLARLDKVKSGSEPIKRAAAADLLFDINETNTKLKVRMRKVAELALTAAGQQVFDELRMDDPWKTPPTEVLHFLRSRENKIVGATQAVFDSVRAQLEEGFNNGEPTAQLADRIRAVFNEASKGRAKTIAITETAAAYGQGRHAAMRDAGVEWKEWLTSGNDNVRPAHAEANGQRVKVGDPFLVGGEHLMHPGDPNGSPELVINCFPADADVSAAWVEKSFKRLYSGPIVSVHLRSGRVITATPNHPVLTQRGWVNLGLIDEDDYLVGTPFGDNSLSADPKINNNPSTFAQVNRALAKIGSIEGVTITPVDFHGDGKQGEVDVVTTDRQLSYGDKSALLENFEHSYLSLPGMVHRALVRLGSLAHLGVASGHSADGIMGCGSVGASLGGTESLHAIKLSLRPVPNLDASGNEPWANPNSIYREPLRESVFGDSLLVELDQVLELRRSQFVGFVHNLQTRHGFYLSQGICSRNCHCVQIAVEGPEGTV